MWEILTRNAKGTLVVIDTASTEAEALAKQKFYQLQNKYAVIRDTAGYTNDTNVYSPTQDAIARAEAKVAEAKAKVVAATGVYNSATGNNVSIDKPMISNKPMIATIITFMVVIAIFAAYKG